MTKLAILAASLLALFAANAAPALEYHVKDVTIFTPGHVRLPRA